MTTYFEVGDWTMGDALEFRHVGWYGPIPERLGHANCGLASSARSRASYRLQPTCGGSGTKVLLDWKAMA